MNTGYRLWRLTEAKRFPPNASLNNQLSDQMTIKSDLPTILFDNLTRAKLHLPFQRAQRAGDGLAKRSVNFFYPEKSRITNSIF